MIDNGEPLAGSSAPQVRFGDRHPYAIAQSLAQRARCCLHPWQVMPSALYDLGDAARLAKLLDLFQRHIVAGEMQQAVQQHRTVTGRQAQTVPLGTIGDWRDCAGGTRNSIPIRMASGSSPRPPSAFSTASTERDRNRIDAEIYLAPPNRGS